MTKPELDVTAVVRRFGGRAQLYRKLCLHKVGISHRTIDNWIYHGIIPMHRFIQLVAIANADGFKLKLEDYIKNGQHKNDSARTGTRDRITSVDAKLLQAQDSAS
jgi:hypothetical protein